MKKILLLVITALIAVSTSLALESMKVGFVYTGPAPVTVHVQLADNTNNAIFTGEDFLNVTPNSSGVIVVDVRDHGGSANAWTNFQASDVSTANTLDIYVGTTLYAQYRLDALILSQAQGGILDKDGNLTPPIDGGGSLGTDGNRWSELYVEGNTVHIGPALGAGAGDELSFSYDDGTNTATMTVAGATALTAVDDNINIPEQATIDGLTIGQGSGNILSNTALGNGALANNTTGTDNTANGRSALNNNTTGSSNTANGVYALASNTTGVSNTANGVHALASNSTGSSNTANGSFALFSNIGGNSNTASGASALLSNTTGFQNTAMGFQSLVSNSDGFSNTAIGVNALEKNTSGTYNSALGYNAGNRITTGNNNIFIGLETGSIMTTQKVDVNNSIAIGYLAFTEGDNSIAIGANTHTTADNQVVIGDANITETQLRGATLADLAGGGTQNARISNTGKIEANSTVSVHFSGTAPTSPVTGSLWYDTGASKLKIWNGGAWVTI